MSGPRQTIFFVLVQLAKPAQQNYIPSYFEFPICLEITVKLKYNSKFPDQQILKELNLIFIKTFCENDFK